SHGSNAFSILGLTSTLASFVSQLKADCLHTHNVTDIAQFGKVGFARKSCNYVICAISHNKNHAIFTYGSANLPPHRNNYMEIPSIDVLPNREAPGRRGQRTIQRNGRRICERD